MQSNHLDATFHYLHCWLSSRWESTRKSLMDPKIAFVVIYFFPIIVCNVVHNEWTLLAMVCLTSNSGVQILAPPEDLEKTGLSLYIIAPIMPVYVRSKPFYYNGLLHGVPWDILTETICTTNYCLKILLFFYNKKVEISNFVFCLLSCRISYFMKILSLSVQLAFIFE